VFPNSLVQRLARRRRSRDRQIGCRRRAASRPPASAGPTLARCLLVGLAVCLTAGITSARSEARGASRDPTFGQGRGWATKRIPGATAIAYGAAVVAGGRIVVAGQAITPAGNGQVLVVRSLPDGRLDSSFGSGGIFQTALPKARGPFIATSLAPENATGKLLVAGGYGQGSMLLLRLTSRGRLDRTFGRNRTGVAITSTGGIAQSVAVQRDGGILVGGSNANRNGRPMVVARFTRNGMLDGRFGRAGLAQTVFWNPDLAASAGVSGLATTSDGGVIASGHLDYIGSDGHGSAGVFRLSATGRVVHGFGTAGHVEVAFRNATGGFAQWFPCAMTVRSGGRIVVTGDGSTGPGAAVLSARLTARGVLDPSYGNGGRAVTRGLRGGDSDTTCGAASSAAGTLTVGVGSTLAQLRPDGTPNGLFAPGGLLRIVQPRGVTINAVAPSGSQRLVVAGSAGNALYVARYRLPQRP
jgi:uncharacterized delta-60 repeat protein